MILIIIAIGTFEFGQIPMYGKNPDPSSIGIDTLIGENGFGLSGGERQRIGIARLLYAKKEILIFDESTSNLDHKNKEKFIKTINQLSKEKTIIIISHDESVIKNCKIKYIVKEKKLIKIN